LRLNASQSKKLQRDASKFTAKKFGTSGATSGLSSSLAFTPIQGACKFQCFSVSVPLHFSDPSSLAGIELANPMRAPTLGAGGTDSVFGASRGFSRVSRELRAP
jgi:hypothetical protein